MEYKLNKDNYYLRVTQADDCESPNDWGNEDMFLVYDHRQFTVTRDGFDPKEVYEYLQHCSNPEDIDLRNDDFDKYWVFPVYAYIHSGISLSLGNGTYPFTCRFDTSVTGFVLVQKDQTIEGKAPIIVTEPEAIKYAEGLINFWNIYLSGEIYDFQVIEKRDNVEYLTSLILDQFDKTKFLTKLGREFTDTMIKDILKKNLSTDLIEEIEHDFCSGFYQTGTEEEMIENMLSHTEFSLYMP